MVIKKGFTLLVATKTKPFFVVVPIISDHACSLARFIGFRESPQKVDQQKKTIAVEQTENKIVLAFS